MTGLSGVSGLVVAGGTSSRLGQDKRAVRIGGTTLLNRAVDLLTILSDDVMIAVPSGAAVASPAGVRVVTDAVPDRGPMAGILSGLEHAREQRVLVIPVDMPVLTVPFLRFLADRDPGAAVTVPRWRAGLEPLVAVYHTNCAADLAARVDRGTTALHAFLTSTSLHVRIVDEVEIRAYGEPAHLFLNINTPDDLTRAEQLLGGDLLPPGRP